MQRASGSWSGSSVAAQVRLLGQAQCGRKDRHPVNHSWAYSGIRWFACRATHRGRQHGPVLPQRRGAVRHRLPYRMRERLAARQSEPDRGAGAAECWRAGRGAARSARNAWPGPCRRTRRTPDGWRARSATRPAGRTPPRPAGSAVDSAPSAIAKKALRNGSTREPSDVVPSGNRNRLSPAASRSRITSRSRPVAWRWRETKTVRPSRAMVPTNGQPATSSLDTKQASSLPAEHRHIKP